MGRTPGKRWHWSCLWSAPSAILALILAHLPFIHSIELKTLDARFRQFPDPGLARGDIVLIVGDEESGQQLQSILSRWPWPRDAYGLMTFLEASWMRNQRQEEAESGGLMRSHPIHAGRISELRIYIQGTLPGVEGLPRLAPRYAQWTQGRT